MPDRPFGKWLAAAVVLLLVDCACGRLPTRTSAASSARTEPLSITMPAFHSGQVGAAYNPVQLSATGGKAPYGWTVSNGALPEGLTLSSTGTVSGTPGAAGGFTFTVRVTDALNGYMEAEAAITIGSGLVVILLPACADACTVEEGCTTVCGTFGAVGGGTPPYSYTLSGSPPAGTQVDGLVLAGTFASPETVQFAVTVTDSVGATATISPTFRVIPHISLAGGSVGGAGENTCYISCSRSFPYTGGAGTPTVAITDWSATGFCNVCPNPPPTPSVSIDGDQVVISVARSEEWLIGYYGTLTLVLTDEMPCGPSIRCSTGRATFTVNVWGGTV